jgi:hypothetical protein
MLSSDDALAESTLPSVMARTSSAPFETERVVSVRVENESQREAWRTLQEFDSGVLFVDGVEHGPPLAVQLIGGLGELGQLGFLLAEGLDEVVHAVLQLLLPHSCRGPQSRVTP